MPFSIHWHLSALNRASVILAGLGFSPKMQQQPTKWAYKHTHTRSIIKICLFIKFDIIWDCVCVCLGSFPVDGEWGWHWPELFLLGEFLSLVLNKDGCHIHWSILILLPLFHFSLLASSPDMLLIFFRPDLLLLDGESDPPLYKHFQKQWYISYSRCLLRNIDRC